MSADAIIVRNPHNIQIADWPWTFRVPSTSVKGVSRFVDWGSMRCDCPAGRHAKPCKHVRWVDEYCRLIWRQAIQRMSQGEAGMRLLREVEALSQP